MDLLVLKMKLGVVFLTRLMIITLFQRLRITKSIMMEEGAHSTLFGSKYCLLMWWMLALTMLKDILLESLIELILNW